MEEKINGLNRQQIIIDTTVSSRLMRSVFTWMAIGLGITGLTAMAMFNTGQALHLVMNSGLFYGLIIGELVLVGILSFAINKISFPVATLIFAGYSLLNGVTLSSIFLLFTQTSIATTFYVSAGMFAVMAIFGYTTKKDLSKLGNILYMALFGLIIALLVNLFLRNGMMDLIISFIGVFLFTGLTMYDTQKIKGLIQENAYEINDQTQKLALMGALSLYLDFINLFLFLLRFLGRNK